MNAQDDSIEEYFRNLNSRLVGYEDLNDALRLSWRVAIMVSAVLTVARESTLHCKLHSQLHWPAESG